MTIVTGSAAIGGGSPAASCSTRDVEGSTAIGSGVALLDGVTAELVAHRREQSFGEWIAFARSEAREQRRGQDRQRNRLLDAS